MDKDCHVHVSGDGDNHAQDKADAPAGCRVSACFTIAELAAEAGVTLRTLRTLRFYQSKGLLAPHRNGHTRVFSQHDRERLALILHGKQLGFTLSEIREMLAARARGCTDVLPISRKQCVEQINLLERQRRDIDRALAELREIYTGMFTTPDMSRKTASASAAGKSRHHQRRFSCP